MRPENHYLGAEENLRISCVVYLNVLFPDEPKRRFTEDTQLACLCFMCADIFSLIFITFKLIILVFFSRQKEKHH